MERKRILYVDKFKPSHEIGGGIDRSVFEEREKKIREVVDVLKSKFDVDVRSDLGRWILILLRDLKSGERSDERYDALVSHFPYDSRFQRSGEGLGWPIEKFYRRLYEPSSNIIKQIRTLTPTLPIIVYSGAGDPERHTSSTPIIDKILTECGVSEIVYKSRDAASDAKIILSKLEGLFKTVS